MDCTLGLLGFLHKKKSDKSGFEDLDLPPAPPPLEDLPMDEHGEPNLPSFPDMPQTPPLPPTSPQKNQAAVPATKEKQIPEPPKFDNLPPFPSLNDDDFADLDTKFGALSQSPTVAVKSEQPKEPVQKSSMPVLPSLSLPKPMVSMPASERLPKPVMPSPQQEVKPFVPKPIFKKPEVPVRPLFFSPQQKQAVGRPVPVPRNLRVSGNKLYVNLETFKSAIFDMQDIRARLREADTDASNLEETKRQKEHAIHEFALMMHDVRKKLMMVDKKLFSEGE